MCAMHVGGGYAWISSSGDDGLSTAKLTLWSSSQYNLLHTWPCGSYGLCHAMHALSYQNTTAVHRPVQMLQRFDSPVRRSDLQVCASPVALG